jgi:B-box zinc finger.
MKCTTHKDEEAIGMCVHCGKPFCEECLTEIDGKYYCEDGIKELEYDNTPSHHSTLQKETPPKKKSNGCLIGCGSLIGVILLFWFLFTIMPSGGNSSSKPNGLSDVEVVTHAQVGLKDYLKSPSSVVFPKGSKNYDIVKDGLKYTVSSTLEAANSFGALIKSKFKITIEFENSKYETYYVRSVEIDGKKIK